MASADETVARLQQLFADMRQEVDNLTTYKQRQEVHLQSWQAELGQFKLQVESSIANNRLEIETMVNAMTTTAAQAQIYCQPEFFQNVLPR